MRCTNCGTLPPNHARFCGSCGAPLPDTSASASAGGRSGAGMPAPTPLVAAASELEETPTRPLRVADLVRPADEAGAEALTPARTPPWLEMRSALASAGAWSDVPSHDTPPSPERPAAGHAGWQRLAAALRGSLASVWKHDRPFVLVAAVALALLTAAWLAWAVDWGTGLLLLGALTVLASVAIFEVAGIRALRQWHASQRVVRPGALVLAAMLAVLGGIAILLVSPVRAVEAVRLEAAGRYAQAATLYARAGERAPDGRDLARALVEDGTARAQRSDFAGAARTLQGVVDRFPGTPEGANARSLLAQVELGWGEQLRARSDYAGAAVHLSAVLTLYPGSSAAVRARPLLAQALLRRALAAQVQQEYDRAEMDLRAVAQRFPDLPEAGQARQVLAAGQTVTGRLVHTNGASVAGATIMLAARWSMNASTNALVTSGHTYMATTAADGRFVVPGVPPGATYALVWDAGQGETSVIDPTRNVPVYMVSVQPLRPADMGDVVVA